MSASKVEANRPPKRMRLGTKSCAECRRRKVRCIYPPNSPICKECALHDAVCVAQTPRQADHMTDDSFEDEKNMRQRLEELEGMVRHLCRAVDINGDPSKPGRFEISADSLKRLRQASTPEPSSNSFSDSMNSVEPSESDNATSLLQTAESFEDAPLLHLFKAAMLIEGNEVHGSLERTGLTARHRIQACIKSLNALIPNFEDLTLILQTTEKYWPLWQAFPEDVLPRSGHPQSNDVARVRNYILESVRSSSGVIVAKAVLCLALCVQQLPASFKYQRPSLPAAPSALVDSYLASAETLLPVNEGSAGTIDGLECFFLQQRLYINMGKPRNAWLCLRRAMSYALLQGLHNLDDSADERRKGIWSHIWQHDRFSCLILGLPPAIADTHPGILRPHTGQSIHEQVIYHLSIVAGHIAERNLNHQNVDYAATERIEQELIECRNGIGSTVLNTIPNHSMPLKSIYGLQTLKLFYHNIRKLTHLPYMLKSNLDKKYEHNRLEALDAAREMIGSWQLLRDCSGSSTLVCDLMDFLVFTAAITIILNLLSQSCPDPIHQQTSDWELIHDITRNMNNVSAEMECNVACQAARLLEYLSAAHQGTYEGPETYEAVIPYFGKVRISQVRKAIPPRAEEGPLLNFSEQDLFWNRVEFNADSFVPFSQNYMGDYLTDAELGVDWTSILSMDNNRYDWSQLYNSSSSTMI